MNLPYCQRTVVGGYSKRREVYLISTEIGADILERLKDLFGTANVIENEHRRGIIASSARKNRLQVVGTQQTPNVFPAFARDDQDKDVFVFDVNPA